MKEYEENMKKYEKTWNRIDTMDVSTSIPSSLLTLGLALNGKGPIRSCFPNSPLPSLYHPPLPLDTSFVSSNLEIDCFPSPIYRFMKKLLTFCSIEVILIVSQNFIPLQGLS
jgi:hypothetical protein